jgi:hypothetical protein
MREHDGHLGTRMKKDKRRAVPADNGLALPGGLGS